jgi:hypothetical protein
MASKRLFWTALALFLVLGALLAPHSATASSSVGIAIDALPGGGVDSSGWAAEMSAFNVEIVITEASTPYQAYQAEIQWDAAVLAYDSATHLTPAELTLCDEPRVLGNTVAFGCIREPGPTTFTGPVDRVAFHCLANGTSVLHLVTPAEDPDFGTTALGTGGVIIETTLADAQITCGEGGPVPTATPGGPGPSPTPGGPVATPTPLPPGYEAVELAAGCNPVTSTYPNATPIGTIAAAVGPAGNLNALWQFESGVWLGYSPAYPQASDLTASDLLDVIFICVAGPGSLGRPIV